MRQHKNSKRSAHEHFKLNPSSVRGRLLFFATILLIPTAIWIALNVVQQRGFLFKQADMRAGNFTSLIAEQYAQEIDEGQTSLVSLADLYTQDASTACATLGIMTSARLSKVAIVDASGNSVCSASETLPAYDETWLNGLANGDSQTLINEENFTLGYAADGHLFLASYNLDWMEAWFESVTLPAGSHLSLLTQNGMIVAQYPLDASVIGQPFHDGGLFMRMTQDGLTSASAPNRNGDQSFYRQSPVGESLILMLEVPQTYIFGLVKDAVIQTLAGLVLLVAVIFSLAWVVSSRMFIRPVHQLIAATERLASGDLTARTDLPHSIVELDRLAYTINQLVVSLNRRDDEVANYTGQLEAEISKHKETLKTLEKTIHLLRTENLARLEMQKADERKLQFLGIIAHELKTPLTSIKGFARTLLATDVEWDEQNQREFIGVIDDEADQLINLVEQLLDVSQIESGRLSTHRVSTCFNNILRMAQPRLEVVTAKHTLKTDIPDKLPTFYADPHRITQVIVNLVGNAAKYSPENTTITLSMKLVDDQKIQVDVTDEGVGISPKDRRNLFQPFQRVYDEKKRIQGAGLGLVICRGIVEAHGGEIWIAERQGPGTTFSFTLPLVPHHDDIMTTMQ